MASLLPTEIANIVANAFKGQLMTGVLKRPSASGLDAKGDPVVTFSTHSVEGIRDNFNARFATLQGIPHTDVKILLIMNLIVPAIVPQKDDLVFIRDEWHKVREVLTIDPASASIELQAFACPAPE